MAWPLEREASAAFAEGLEEILVVEEKRAGHREPAEGTALQLARRRAAAGDRQVRRGRRVDPAVDQRADPGAHRPGDRPAHRPLPHQRDHRGTPQVPGRQGRRCSASRRRSQRIPYFCSGCPHNTSTKVPEGSRALAGIGCHYMVQWMDRRPRPSPRWAARACPGSARRPSRKTKHVFANLGDGTYFHSGILAMRACVAAGVNITFKVLYNDAVAMTGGQPWTGRSIRR